VLEPEQIEGRLTFLHQAERLKDTLRSAYTATGQQENAAAHSWRLSLLALVFADQYPEIDLLRLLKLCIIHELGEALRGDIPAPLQTDDENKAVAERRDFTTLLQSLEPVVQSELLALWDEYDQAVSPEAILAKGLDKLETILQHNQGANPADFDYIFNLDYGRQYTDRHPFLVQLRAILDRNTRANAKNQA
jgi:putative hydrolase of HD superfamily